MGVVPREVSVASVPRWVGSLFFWSRLWGCGRTLGAVRHGGLAMVGTARCYFAPQAMKSGEMQGGGVGCLRGKPRWWPSSRRPKALASMAEKSPASPRLAKVFVSRDFFDAACSNSRNCLVIIFAFVGFSLWCGTRENCSVCSRRRLVALCRLCLHPRRPKTTILYGPTRFSAEVLRSRLGSSGEDLPAEAIYCL